MFPFCSCYILNQVCFLGVDTVLTLGKCVHTVGVWNYAHSLEVCSNCRSVELCSHSGSVELCSLFGSVFKLWKCVHAVEGKANLCRVVTQITSDILHSGGSIKYIYIGHNVLWTEKFCNPNLKLLVGPEKRSFPPKFLRKVSDLLQFFNFAALKLQINMNQRGIQVFFSFN